MKIRAEIDLEIDDNVLPPFDNKSKLFEKELIEKVQDAESWVECKVLKARVIKE